VCYCLGIDDKVFITNDKEVKKCRQYVQFGPKTIVSLDSAFLPK